MQLYPHYIFQMIKFLKIKSKMESICLLCYFKNKLILKIKSLTLDTPILPKEKFSRTHPCPSPIRNAEKSGEDRFSPEN